jgi:hypothetical protein
VAVAGIDPEGFANTAIELDGTESADPDNDALTYEWAFINGPSVPTITNADQPTAQFFADTPGIYNVSLTVTDTHDAVGTTSISVIVVNQIPEVDAGPFLFGVIDQEIATQGTATDADGDQLTYLWEVLNPGGTISFTDTDQPIAHFIAEAIDFAPREYLVQLTVTDVWGDSASDMTAIVIENRDPVANAGPDLEVIAGETVALDGSMSSDPDHHSLFYEWDFASEQGDAIITEFEEVIAHFSAQTPGVYELKLTVFDIFEHSSTDTVLVTVISEEDAIEQVQNELDDAVQSLSGGTGVVNSLAARLQNIEKDIDDPDKAAKELQKFIDDVSKRHAKGDLTDEEAAALLELAEALAALL